MLKIIISCYTSKWIASNTKQMTALQPVKQSMTSIVILVFHIVKNRWYCENMMWILSEGEYFPNNNIDLVFLDPHQGLPVRLSKSKSNFHSWTMLNLSVPGNEERLAASKSELVIKNLNAGTIWLRNRLQRYAVLISNLSFSEPNPTPKIITHFKEDATGEMRHMRNKSNRN